MSVIVRDTGFCADDWIGEAAQRQDLPGTTDPAGLAAIWPGKTLLCIDFASPADGRGFTLARLLRLSGFKGRLRARGELLPDQYPLARRAGFDEIEIDPRRAQRQPENQWISQSHLYTYDYQSRLRGTV